MTPYKPSTNHSQPLTLPSLFSFVLIMFTCSPEK